MSKKQEKFDAELIKKAARLLKGETLEPEQLEAYTLHSKSIKKYKRLKIHVEKRNDQWSIDLAEMKDLSRFNKQFRYILVCVDVFSRYAFVRLLKKKSSENVKKKFESIITEHNEKPKKIQCDEGTEFQGIKKHLALKYNFKVFHTYNREIKASHAERFIQTLKTMIRRTLTVVGGYKYVHYLPTIVEKYNESPHKGIFGYTPKQLYLEGLKLNQIKVFKKLLNGSKPTKNLLKTGDKVRLARIKNSVFEKSSLQRWTNETFVISKVFISDPVTYKLRDLNDEDIDGIFYREELQKRK